MSVTINDAALNRFLRSTTGPVGRDLALRANSVVERASMNASGQILQVRTGDLRSSIRARLENVGGGELVAVISDSARHGTPPFNYPAFLDQTDFPWLTNALRDGFRLRG